MDKLKGAALAGAAALVIIGGVVYSQLDNWFTPEPTGPGSGDEIEVEPEGPGSGDEIIEGSVHDDYIYENTPGSGDEMPDDSQGPGSGDEIDPNEPTGPGSGDELSFVASCNVINEKSTCVEYTGTYWATPEVAALNCKGVGTYSETSCPRPTSGGCMMNSGNQFEMTSWFYPYGGDPISGENITYAAGACNATGATYIYD